jgi:hypothetical protein
MQEMGTLVVFGAFNFPATYKGVNVTSYYHQTNPKVLFGHRRNEAVLLGAVHEGGVGAGCLANQFSLGEYQRVWMREYLRV